jgi:multidrug efflux pump subunit AcrA (membrane-fusion protein)
VDWDSVPDAGEIHILTGMTADADLITSRRTDVLLVANKAITADRDAGAYYVYRVEGDDVTKVEVTIGLRDKSYTEIVNGLREGDKLVIGYSELAAASAVMPVGGGNND